MFHKHDDRLQRLNDELLAEDEEYYEEEFEDTDLTEEDLADLLGEEEPEEEIPFYQNHANGYGKEIRNYANHYGKGHPKQFDDEMPEEEEDLEDEEFLYRDDYKSAKKAQKKEERQQRKEKRKKLGLAIIALIELIAIIGILVWWASWIL